MAFRERAQVLLGAVIPDGATTVALTAADGFKVGNLKVNTPTQMDDPNYHQDSTNKTARQPGAAYTEITGMRRLTGSGVVGTPPREDWLLRAAALKASTVTGMAASAATYTNVGSPVLEFAASVPTLAANPIGAVIVTTAGPNAGERVTVVSYDDATKKATLSAPFKAAPTGASRYMIPQGTLYTPRLDGYERAEVHHWARNTRDKMKSEKTPALQAAANGSLKFAPGKGIEFSFTLRGQYVKPSEGPIPEPIGYGTEAKVAPQLLSADVRFGGLPFTRFSELSFDLAGTLDQQEDAAEEFGYAAGEINEHSTGGTLKFAKRAISELDAVARFRAGNELAWSAVWGTAGNAFGFTTWLTIDDVPTTEGGQNGRTATSLKVRAARPANWFALHAW